MAVKRYYVCTSLGRYYVWDRHANDFASRAIDSAAEARALARKLERKG